MNRYTNIYSNKNIYCENSSESDGLNKYTTYSYN